MDPIPSILIESQKMAMVGRLATSVIHDVNNYLTLVQLNAAILEAGGMQESEMRDLSGKIGQACTRASELTRKLLDFARRNESPKQIFNAVQVVRSHAALAEAFVTKRADFRVEITETDLWIHGDPSQFEQVILNLVLNAADALSGRNRGTIVLQCRSLQDEMISGEEGSDWVELVVSDNGCGMNRATLDRIFEPLFTSKPHGMGTGMGLYTVNEVIRQHGGHIAVTSEVDKGSVFRVQLPRVPAPGEPRGGEATGREATGSGQVILLVEDDPGIRNLTERILKQVAYRVISAEDIEGAKSLLSENSGQVALLLTDVILPGDVSGVDLALSLWEKMPELPVVFMSGFAESDPRVEFTASNFLQKPFGPETLKAIVRDALKSQI